MKSFRTVGTVRRATISKVCAAVLVVLAALPFTAPFASFDLAEVTGASSHGSPLDAKAPKTSEKATTTAFIDSVIASILLSSILQTPREQRVSDIRQIRTTVLRV
jgi:hypothetical protein